MADKAQSWYVEGFLDDTRTMRRETLRTYPFTLGRRHDRDLCLPFASVSSDHAEIDRVGAQLVVRDHGSRNGTFVNRLRVDGEARLHDGDILHLGQCELRVGTLGGSADFAQTMAVDLDSAALPHRLVSDLPRFLEMLATGAVLPHYQPIVRLDDASVVGHEILGRGALDGLTESPYELFRMAEAAGREAELSCLFREVGIRTAQGFNGTSRLYVNTHPVELQGDGLLASLREIRDTMPDAPLTLEVHEGAATNPTRMRELRAQLEQLGIALAYDDFGAGHARLQELVEVPPDVLKFDIALVKDIDRVPEARRSVVRKLLRMVGDLGIPCLAEGVEREEEAIVCAELGFTYAQGYFYGRPSPAPFDA